MSHATAARPLGIVAMDFTQLERSTSGIENVLVFPDAFTKYIITIPTRDQTTKTVSRLFVPEWIKKLGVPERMHSDQGRSFENQIIKQLCLSYQVKKAKTTPYHPRGNSQIERFNRSMKAEKMDWPLTGIGICLQLYTPFRLHYVVYSILSIFGHDANWAIAGSRKCLMVSVIYLLTTQCTVTWKLHCQWTRVPGRVAFPLHYFLICFTMI